MGSVKLIITALAVGAAAGILFAPAKGAITRKRIAHQAGGVIDEIKNTFEDAVDTMTRSIESVKGDVVHIRRQFMR